MRNDDNSDSARASHDGDAGKASDDRRRASGRKRHGGRAQESEAPFQMGAFMQMLPLLMAMGGAMPGQRMAGAQLRLLMLMVEIWIDYLAAMQEFMERTLDRLRGLSGGRFLFGDDDEADGGTDW